MHAVRMRRFALAATAYGLCLPLMGIAAALGLVPLHVVFEIAAIALAVNAVLFTLFRTGRNERFVDPSLTWLQIVLATMVVMYATYHFDSNRAVALMICLVVLSFGAFRFSTREFMLASGLVLAAYAGVINLLFYRKPEMVNVWLEAFQWITLAFVLPCFAMIGGRLSEMRRRVRQTNDELSSALATIQKLATHDTLTGLPNRAFFNEALGHAIAQAQRNGRSLALFFMDLDRFKNINDTLGHSVGDRVLQEAASRLRGSVRASDMIARLGGDEFVLLVEEYAGTNHLADIAGKVLKAFEPGFEVHGHELALAASIGISTYPQDGADAQTLVSNADIAMYRAKEQGRNRHCFYSAELNKLTEERLVLEAGLKRALERGEIEVFYQPKIDFGHGRVTGVEALIRWRHPTLGLLQPDRFIGIAEETGLIVPIGYWTLRRVCERARKWHEQGLGLSVAVNLSAVQFHQPELIRELGAILKATALPPQLLELEITESMVMKDPEAAVKVMESARRMGLRLSIDDFGTGHSSLGYLKRFPVNQLKVDRMFVRDLPHNLDDVAIARAVIAMAHSLRMSVVAEGVEDEHQFALLRAEGCDEFQGYYCRPPLAEEELMRFLADERASRPLTGFRPSLTT
jgi:diguanylate cyclase (GGDEF)-like protein